MAATLGGIDALLFTGGVGEHAWRIRELACAGLGHLGVELDPSRNVATDGDALVSRAGASVTVLAVHTREDLEMARQTRLLFRPDAPG